ncbi:MAG: tRNA pseudouridine(13) synthase TruD [Ignisphaera sp.]
MNFLTTSLLDILLGLQVYTYPNISTRSESLGGIFVWIERPEGFVVTENVNLINLKEVFDRLSKSPMQIDRDANNRYCVYVAKKQNIDSMSLGYLLKSSLNCNDFEVLGLKDAYAIAYQAVVLSGCRKHESSVKMISSSAIIEAYLWFCSLSRPFLMHNSNKFDIKIALDPHAALDDLIRAINTLKDHDYQFLNFFGYQRFGSRRPITHILGKALIKEDFELFLKVLCKSPPKKSAMLYRSLEDRLCRADNHRIDEELKNLLKDPMYNRIIRFFVNAYQAYLFNRLLSKVWLNVVELHNVRDGLHVLRREFRYLPLPGYNVHVGENVKRFFDEIVEIEGIDLKMFCQNKLEGLCFYGDYRESVTKAFDFDYKIESNVISLSFSLSPGSYATLLLREVMRCNPLLYT